MSDYFENQYQHQNLTFATLADEFVAQHSIYLENKAKLMLFSKSFKIIQESFFWRPSSFYVAKLSPIFEPLEKFILECQQHGIFHHLMSKYELLKEKHEDDLPQVLTWVMLSAGFYVWISSIVVACFIFILEHIVYNISKRIKKSKEKHVQPKHKNKMNFTMVTEVNNNDNNQIYKKLTKKNTKNYSKKH
jgi:hypothetical protein